MDLKTGRLEMGKKLEVTKHVEKKELTVEELRITLRKYPTDSLKFSVIWLLFWFGMRPEELVALDRKMVDFKIGKVTFETEMTRLERELYFDEFTAVHLRRFLGAKPNYAFVYRACEGAGTTPNAIRRSFISYMHRMFKASNFDLVRVNLIVKYIAGHISQDITSTDDIERAFRESHYMIPLEKLLF